MENIEQLEKLIGLQELHLESNDFDYLPVNILKLPKMT